MLRVEVTEAGQGALPAIDLDGAITIGASPSARVRLPAQAASAEHVRIDAGRWYALAPLAREGGEGVPRIDLRAGDSGEVGAGVVFAIGGYRVRVAPSPAGAEPAPPQRTESLARELLRGLLGGDAAPALVIERGPAAGARRALAPPESALVIGRGDEAGWIIADDDLSRAHAEIRRGWDGARVLDLGSKNGTRIDGEAVGPEGAVLADGCALELGTVILRFRDPAEQHLRGERSREASALPQRAPERGDAGRSPPRTPAVASTLPFYVALAIMILALAGLGWILTSCTP